MDTARTGENIPPFGVATFSEMKPMGYPNMGVSILLSSIPHENNDYFVSIVDKAMQRIKWKDITGREYKSIYTQ